MSAKEQNLSQLAIDLGLRETDTTTAIDRIAYDLLYAMDGKSPKIDAEIKRVFKEWSGSDWFKENDAVTAQLLVGPPGHGKTTAFKEAGKKVAKALGMRYLENADLDTVPLHDEYEKNALGEIIKNADGNPKIIKRGIDPEKDFVLVTQEAAGVVSALEWLGLPRAIKLGHGVEAMGRLYSERLLKAQKAGGSIILLDDFLNASPSIQNVGLSLAEERRFNDLNLTNSLIGLTGNLGAHDGTNTSRLSTALRNRCRIFFIQDKLDDFVYRAQTRWTDQFGDVATLGFLRRSNEHFAKLPNLKQVGGFPSPRSWDKVIIANRRAVIRAGGSLAHALKDMIDEASSLLGLEVGQAYTAYMNAYIKSADPLARAAIMDGKFDRKDFKKQMENNMSGDHQYFAYQFAMAASDYAANKIAMDGGKLDVALPRFVDAVLSLDGPNFNLAIDNFKRGLANKVESLSTMQSSKRGARLGREITMDIKQKISNAFVGHPECTTENRTNVIDVLSDSDKYQSVASRRRQRGSST